MTPCSSESSRRSPSRSSRGLIAALSGEFAPWIALWIGIGFAAAVLAFASGCARAVLIPEASPIRIGPRTEARVYFRESNEWVLSPNAVTIPEGWYCVPPSFVEEEQ